MIVCSRRRRITLSLCIVCLVTILGTLQSLPSTYAVEASSQPLFVSYSTNSLAHSPNTNLNNFPDHLVVNPEGSGGQALANPNATNRVHLPLVLRSELPTPTPTTPPSDPSGQEWTQHAHDAQHTSYTNQVVPTPWRWKWAWNGPDAAGGISAGKTGLPRNSQPVTGGGRVYIAAGSRGVFALNNANGAVIWNRTPGGNINSTPAYDAQTSSVFVLSSNGTLYKLDAATGNTLGQFATGASSTLPLPPALADDRVFISVGNRVYAINKNTMAQIWAYDAGSPVHTPPAYSPSRNRVIAVSQDLYVHAINNSNGTRAWRVKPTVRTGGDPGDSNSTLAEVAKGWPVIAEVHGYVLIKLRLDWQAMWGIWSPWPSDNATMRSMLQANPAYQALFALDLDDGLVPFVAHVGHGGYGDGGYLPMGPQPVVKKFANGQEVAYVVMRGSPCDRTPCDGRWDSHFGELLLDNTTVSGYQAGYVRFMRNTFFPTDEQVYISMAGDMIFGGHWAYGQALQITDRSASKGTGTNPITTVNLPHISGADNHAPFNANHYFADYLCAEGCARVYPPGFFIYYTSASVWDQYWTEYATWVVSNNTIYYVSGDGALVALENGNPRSSISALSSSPSLTIQRDTSINPQISAWPAQDIPASDAVIPYTQAHRYVGQVRTVEGTIQFVFNNRQAVYLGFQNPHQGAFKVRILKEHWTSFDAPPETIYRVGQPVRVTGLIEWYQGDPVIYVRDPSQIK